MASTHARNAVYRRAVAATSALLDPLMGEEIVVPGPSARDAGKRIHRRFTDVFRKENGEWRHDLRHAHVISTE